MLPFTPPDWLTPAEQERFQQMFPAPPEPPPEAVAVVNHGRWIARCPRPHCYNAMALTQGQQVFHCATNDGCQLLTPIVWPDNAQEIWEALSERPVPSTRNWAPAGHRQAVETGHPHGQTVAELRAETEAQRGAG